ncbi:MAG: hypothetical protein JW963_07875 [Anaerolineales bacterium]|nr:hypothetical protein [Anaerolineales bacterium]
MLTLLTAAYALGLVLLLEMVTWFPLIMFSYFASGTVAVIAGFGVRLLLSKRHWFIRSIAATVMPLAGLSIQGYFSDWKIGIDVIALGRGYVSWADLIHMILGITASWAALWAWYRPVPSDVDYSTNVEAVRQVVIPQTHRARTPRSWSLQPRLRLGSGTGVQSGNGSRPQVRARMKFVTKQPTRPKRRSSLLSRAHVQLAVVEEHRCPYCLEPVSRDDPGGVKECEVCHSLHHADCWAITGVCQVPHLNT